MIQVEEREPRNPLPLIACIIGFLLLAELVGCAFLSKEEIVKQPLPEPEGFSVVKVVEKDDKEAIKLKAENAELVAKIETLSSKTAAEKYETEQTAKQKIYDLQKTHEVEISALEEKLKAANEKAKYPTSAWLWAIISAAIAAVIYAYKHKSFATVALALGGFACLFSLVLAGRDYPQLVIIAPIPFIIVLFWVAYREGIIRDALRACVRGIEIADCKAVKQAVNREDKFGAVELAARKDIDAVKGVKKDEEH